MYINGWNWCMIHSHLLKWMCFIYSLKNVPQVSKTQVWKNLVQLLEEATSEDDIHDVEFLVSLWHMHLLSHNVISWLNQLVLFNFCLGYTLQNYYYGLVLGDLEKATRQQWRQYAQIKKRGLINGRAAIWAPEVEFSIFRTLSRSQLTFPFCC